MSQPQILAMVLNFSFVLVIAVVGWLLRRAIAQQDETLKLLGTKMEANNQAINSLQLLIVGDYYPRKEHVAFAEHVNHVLDQIRANVHALRTELQSNVSRVAILETKIQLNKEARNDSGNT